MFMVIIGVKVYSNFLFGGMLDFFVVVAGFFGVCFSFWHSWILLRPIALVLYFD